MEENKYIVSSVVRIWNDKTGERLEISEDRDGLDLVEVRSLGRDGKEQGCLLVDVKMAGLLIQALQKYLKDRAELQNPWVFVSPPTENLGEVK